MKKRMIALLISLINPLLGGLTTQNQTDELSKVVQNRFSAFQVLVEEAPFALPAGIQSYAWASYEGEWIFLAGRMNGLHGFSSTDDNFPPNEQNRTVFVVDPSTGAVYTRSLLDPTSGLTQEQIDSLSVTSPQSYSVKKKLYMTGGYGIHTETGEFGTFDKLTVINIPGLISWVKNPAPGQTAAQYIRQISNPIFKVTGGDMFQFGQDPTLLIFGQDFSGFYEDSSNGMYTHKVRRFHIFDDGLNLSVKVLPSKPTDFEPAYRRRDMNIIPTIHYDGGHYKQGFIGLSGVFTLMTGIWTVPVEISHKGHPCMKNPWHKTAFKQGMNNYQCPVVPLFSKKTKMMYMVLMGGITYGYFENGVFEVDDEIPFTNQITTVTRDKHGYYGQFLMDTEYPVILSTQSNPGNQQ